MKSILSKKKLYFQLKILYNYKEPDQKIFSKHYSMENSFLEYLKYIFFKTLFNLLFALNFIARYTQKCGGMGRRKNATGSAQIKSRSHHKKYAFL